MYNKLNCFFLERSRNQTVTYFLKKKHQTNSFDLATNDLGYEYSRDVVCLNSFDRVFVHTEVRCANETKTAQTAK